MVLSRTLGYSWFCRHPLLAGVPVFFNFISFRCRPGHGRDMIYHIDPKVIYVPLTLVNIERRVHSDLKATLMLNSLQTHLMSSLISGHIEYYHQRSLLLSLLLSVVSCVEHCDWSCQENWSVWRLNVVNFLLKVVLHADDAPGPVMDTSPRTPLQDRVGWWDSNGDTGLCEWASCWQRCPVCHPFQGRGVSHVLPAPQWTWWWRSSVMPFLRMRKVASRLPHQQEHWWRGRRHLGSPHSLQPHLWGAEGWGDSTSRPLLQPGAGWCCLQCWLLIEITPCRVWPLQQGPESPLLHLLLIKVSEIGGHLQ